MPGIDVLGVATKQHGHLVDDHLVDQIGQVIAVVRPDLKWPAIEHDPRRQPVPGLRQPRREQSGQRDIAVLENVTAVDEFVRAGCRQVRHVLHGELDAIEFALPAQFEVLDGVEHEVIELSGSGAGQRDRLRDQPAAEPTAPAVT